MSLIYIWFLGISTVVVSVTGAYFSVSGLAELFGGSAKSVLIMAASLEFSKFVIVGFLYRYWGHIHRPLKAYLCFAIGVLMIITSVGIYGYLSQAYQISATSYHAKIFEIESLEKENQTLQTQITEYKNFIDQIPAPRITQKFEFQKKYQPQIEDLRQRSDSVVYEMNEKKSELMAINPKVGPIIYVAKALGTDIDTAVKYLIFIFVLVFDPLAVCLVFCLNLIIRLREKYRGDEHKIGAHSLTTPVDHRYRKSA